MDKKCAPGKTFTEGSCFTLEDLKEIATKYNDNYSDKDFLRELIPKFKKQFDCDDQTCWLSKDPVKAAGDDIKNYTFRPNGPKKQFDWLSTEDIESVMKQYEKVHKDFKFLGAIPSYCPVSINCELSNLDLMDLKKKKIHKIGIIYNLDVTDCVWYIISTLVDKKLINK